MDDTSLLYTQRVGPSGVLDLPIIVKAYRHRPMCFTVQCLRSTRQNAETTMRYGSYFWNEPSVPLVCLVGYPV